MNNEDTKPLFCKSCNKETEHIPTHFRKTFEKQWYRCKKCGEERQ